MRTRETIAKALYLGLANHRLLPSRYCHIPSMTETTLPGIWQVGDGVTPALVLM